MVLVRRMKMDDLISRKSVAKKMLYRRDYVGRPSDPDCIIADEPPVPAVPLDKLCELLAEANYVVPCRICEYCDTDDCEIFPCPSTAEDWRNALTKWMEGLDDTNRHEDA